MAEERIDIKVTDSGSDKAAKGLRAIAAEATKAQKAVDQVSARLANLPASQLNAMAAAASKAADASSRVAAAEQKAASAIAATASATTAANSEASRSITIINSRTRSAEAAAKAEERFAASQKEWAANSAGWQRELAAQNANFAKVQQDVANAMGKSESATDGAARANNSAANSTESLARRARALKSSLDPLYAAQARANTKINEARDLYLRGAISSDTYRKATASAKAELDEFTAAQTKSNNSTKLAGHHQANLVAQINDIGVSLASGQNPFLVMIQQGSQLQDLSMRVDGGFKTLARSTLALAAPFAAAAAIFGVMAARFIDFRKEIDEDAGLKEYVKTLGLTKDELKELENQHVTFGDVALGVWDTFNEAMNLSEAFDNFKAGFSATMKFIWDVFKGMTFGLLTAFIGTYRSIIAIWNGFPKAFGDIFEKSINAAIGGLETLLNGSVAVLNKLGGNFETITLKRMVNSNAGAAVQMGRDIVSAYADTYKELEDNYNFGAAVVSSKAQDRARSRLKSGADEIIADRSDRGGRTRTGRSGPTEEEKREEALRRVNAQLDNEISRMGMLKKEREVQQRFDQINEQLLRQRIVLTDEETASIKNKIAQVQELADVQSAMDRIYDDLNKATDDYNATLEAADRLLDAGRISYEQYAQAVTKAKNAHDEAVDPLYRMGLEQDKLYRSLGKYGDELEQVNYYEQIRAALLKEEGTVLSPQYVEGENAKTDALMRGNAELQRRLALQAAINNATAPYMPQAPGGNSDGDIMRNAPGMYEELERQRQEDLINEQSYNNQKLALDKALYNARLGFASEFFGNLASLTSSGNRELAAIGKAAAITQATIDGYLAVQKALAAYPPPWNFAMAASVGVATAAQIAGIMSTNTGNFATGGQIMVGGRDGVDKNNINMNVTKGERVTIETPAQQKATDEALARGQSGGSGDVKVTSVNVVDPRFVIDSMDTAAGGKVIMNYITSNQQQINAVLGRR